MTEKSDINPHDKLGEPLDPTTNPEGFMGETYGLSGVTVGDPSTPSNANVLEEAEQSGYVPNATDPLVERKMETFLTTKTVNQDSITEQIGQATTNLTGPEVPPSVLGEQAISGDMPDVESDDDMLLNSHGVGLRLDEDYENPKPLDIARDVNAAESNRRGLGDFDLDD